MAPRSASCCSARRRERHSRISCGRRRCFSRSAGTDQGGRSERSLVRFRRNQALSSPSPTGAPFLMRLSATTVILTAALLSIGCGFLYLTWHWSSPPPNAESAHADPPPAPSDLAPAIADLRRAIEELNRTIQARHLQDPGTPSPRESLLPASGSQEQLTIAITKLSDLLGASGERISSMGMADRPWKASGYPSLYSIWQAFDAARASNARGGLNVLNPQLERAHVGWARQDVIDRYGPPTHITGAPLGLVLMYTRTADQPATGT